jgi:hypothetical protein
LPQVTNRKGKNTALSPALDTAYCTYLMARLRLLAALLSILWLHCLPGTVNCASQADFGKAWGLLPPESEWYKLVKAYNTKSQCRAHVKVYMEPYKEFQLASRNGFVTPSKLKTSLTTALDLLYSASRALEITSQDYSGSNYDELIFAANNVFRFGKARSLRPVFDPQVLEAFSGQRLRDLIANKANYIQFSIRKYQYEQALREWSEVANRVTEDEYRNIFPRNLDLDYAEERIVYYVYEMMERTMEYPSRNLPKIEQLLMHFYKDEWIKKIELLGNGASLSAQPPSFFLAGVLVFYTILISLLI